MAKTSLIKSFAILALFTSASSQALAEVDAAKFTELLKAKLPPTT